jgi:hypothetical protein
LNKAIGGNVHQYLLSSGVDRFFEELEAGDVGFSAANAGGYFLANGRCIGRSGWRHPQGDFFLHVLGFYPKKHEPITEL